MSARRASNTTGSATTTSLPTAVVVAVLPVATVAARRQRDRRRRHDAEHDARDLVHLAGHHLRLHLAALRRGRQTARRSPTPSRRRTSWPRRTSTRRCEAVVTAINADGTVSAVSGLSAKVRPRAARRQPAPGPERDRDRRADRHRDHRHVDRHLRDRQDDVLALRQHLHGDRDQHRPQLHADRRRRGPEDPGVGHRRRPGRDHDDLRRGRPRPGQVLRGRQRAGRGRAGRRSRARPARSWPTTSASAAPGGRPGDGHRQARRWPEGGYRAWACPTAASGADWQPCTMPVKLGDKAARLRVTVDAVEKVRVVVARRGR